MAFLMYGNTIRNGYSLDDTYVTQNNLKVQKGFAGIKEIFTSRYVDEEGNAFGYRPVAMATFAIEYELWGQNPHMSHFINVVLYSLILLFLFKILRKIFKNTHILFLLAVVLLFAAHPIHTEVVASLKNRETLLSFLFSLAAFASFLKWMDNRRKRFVITGVFFFILAFLSKQDSVTFAAVIPLALFYYSSEPITAVKTTDWRRSIFSTPYVYLVLATISFALFFYATRKLGMWISIFTYFLTITCMLLFYLWNKHNKELDKYRKLSLLFLITGILLFLLAVNFLSARLAFLSLISFAIFFFRIPENDKIRLISIPRVYLTLLIPLIVLGLTVFYFISFLTFTFPSKPRWSIILRIHSL